MSKYTIDHVCGHSEVVQICGPTKDRAGKAEWMASRKCLECRQADKAKARDNEREVNGCMALLLVEGSQLADAVAEKKLSETMEEIKR